MGRFPAMQALPRILLLLLVLWQARLSQGADLASTIMPRPGDYTLMGWAEEFPGHTPGAPWRRVIQTGCYAMALDTETLRIPHFGALAGQGSYAQVARAGGTAWETLPPAVLDCTLTANGKIYRCSAGGTWSQFGGPRLIESGRFVQRGDVTGLEFTAGDGSRWDAEARLETVAWPDRLSLIFAARPGLQPIQAGEAGFGRVGGGFGLDGTNHLEIPHAPELDPEVFTLELWAFVPADFKVSERTHPWLVCKNQHEQADGNFGIVILDGKPQARMNIGGGRENQFATGLTRGEGSPGNPVRLRLQEWNHLAMSYDGDTLRLVVNGAPAGECKIGRRRVPGREGLAFGRRQDNCGDGYHFRGVIDEIRLYDRALTPAEIGARFRNPEGKRPELRPVKEWGFRADGVASATQPGETWNEAGMSIRLATKAGVLEQDWESPKGQSWTFPEWREVVIAIDPVTMRAVAPVSSLTVRVAQVPGGKACPVDYDAARSWHRIDLDGIEPAVPSGPGDRRNDAMERVKLTLANPGEEEQTARLLFEKSASGICQRIGAPITGISAILRTPGGEPTGIPVQLSKNWHNRPEGGVYAGQWFHGFSQVRVPPRTEIQLELALVYGHWGGVPAASHAQLCLIGWGSNQLWEQSALGSWGESICYEPDQVQAQCGILDVRPVMVASMNGNQRWSWTHNVGGGDFFRLFDPAGKRVFPGRMRTAHERYGPCLTEVTYAGRLGEGIEHSSTVSLARTGDLVRGMYRLRLDVRREVDFSRFVIFQIGADTYSYTGERKMALGNENGLLKEWDTQWGGDGYRTKPVECSGRVPWISLHQSVHRASERPDGAWANRGIVIRSWSAKLGGRQAAPWMAERGTGARGADTSTADLVPPPDVTKLLPGDYIEAAIEHLIVPQSAADYYGPDQALRNALSQWADTWRMVDWEAKGNERRVIANRGSLERVFPSILIRAEGDAAEFSIQGGLGYVPVTFAGLSSATGFLVCVDGRPIDQGVHGKDYWQADYDPVAGQWSLTYNLAVSPGQPHSIRLERKP